MYEVLKHESLKKVVGNLKLHLMKSIFANNLGVLNLSETFT